MESKSKVVKNLQNAYVALEGELDGIEDPTSLYLWTEILSRIEYLLEDIKDLE